MLIGLTAETLAEVQARCAWLAEELKGQAASAVTERYTKSEWRRITQGRTRRTRRKEQRGG